MTNNRAVWVFGALSVVGLLALGILARAVFAPPAMTGAAPQVGGDIMLSGAYDDDVAVLAQTVTVLADAVVAGDASFVAPTTRLNGRFDGNVTVLGDSVVLDPNTVVNGDIALNAGTAMIDGQINGDVLVTGQNITIAAGARISGAVYPCMADVSRLNDTRPGGLVSTCDEAARAGLFNRVESASIAAGLESVPPLMGRIALALLVIALSVGLPVLAVTLMLDRMMRIRAAARERLRDSFSAFAASACIVVGLTALITLLLGLVPAAGLAATPFALLLGVGAVLLLAFGYALAALVCGEAVVARFSATHAPLTHALVGGLVLSLIPLVAIIFPSTTYIVLLVLTGISGIGGGAALLTRLGQRTLVRSYFVQG
ncbi:MAG: polymer-forming cytoskeletal protein [Pleurocapsa minor GSE-CHR-MK-17-07R]|nr:polymer-forming cytoskeletal protein [Pleurocapsa minor GSE-CHR-MK 17-07R]